MGYELIAHNYNNGTYTSYGTNFIRDDKRFTDKKYHQILEKKVGKPFPNCLQFLNFYITNNKESIEVAYALDLFFADDENLKDFSEWLRYTSKTCSIYELDF